MTLEPGDKVWIEPADGQTYTVNKPVWAVWEGSYWTGCVVHGTLWTWDVDELTAGMEFYGWPNDNVDCMVEQLVADGSMAP